MCKVYISVCAADATMTVTTSLCVLLLSTLLHYATGEFCGVQQLYTNANYTMDMLGDYTNITFNYAYGNFSFTKKISAPGAVVYEIGESACYLNMTVYMRFYNTGYLHHISRLSQSPGFKITL